jgi:hypothetical protein
VKFATQAREKSRAAGAAAVDFSALLWRRNILFPRETVDGYQVRVIIPCKCAIVKIV